MAELLCPACGHHIGNITINVGGSRTPAHIDAAVSSVSTFLADRCRVDEQRGTFTTSGVLYRAYADWANQDASRSLSPRTFGLALRKIGIPPIRTGGEQRNRSYAGVSLL